MTGTGRAGEEAFVAVGSNIDPERHLVAALRALLASGERVLGCSTFYVTRPLERPEQPRFVNGVWRLETGRGVRELKEDVLRRIEERCGRVRTDDPQAARTVDLDLILFGRRVVREAGLSLPDPDIRTRAFVAGPLLELAPDLIMPDTEEALASLPVILRVASLEKHEELTAKLKGMVES
jgi:2-amino-4-hydroxy-6-hydroxymethyldihydropteridine diphosphokinase